MVNRMVILNSLELFSKTRLLWPNSARRALRIFFTLALCKYRGANFVFFWGLKFDEKSIGDGLEARKNFLEGLKFNICPSSVFSGAVATALTASVKAHSYY